ncbi:hypothetical protein ACGFNU_45570 [Spirillospora sp. NPDC048911]|uniref:hypothetical protein n=1 Tax=Spirillospora sp. NPDC048911 TaxID=3364527 RepID=UPI00371E202D
MWSFARAGDGPFRADIRHFNGRRWSKVRAPGFFDQVSARSSKDIWATGWINGTKGPIASVFRWNGKSWKRQAATLGSNGQFNDILAKGSRDVWSVGSRSNASVLLHWNGKTWKKVSTPSVRGGLTGLVDDGAGGFWAQGRGKFYHYRAGRWATKTFPSRKPFTTVVSALARVPKTTSIWAVGALEDRRQVNAADVILKYGK